MKYVLQVAVEHVLSHLVIGKYALIFGLIYQAWFR